VVGALWLEAGAGSAADPVRLEIDGRPVSRLAAAPDGRAASPGETRGELLTSPHGSRAGGYRWFVADPVSFETSMALESRGPTVVTFWYSGRPAPRRAPAGK
jgi:hypothetical protein